MSWQEGPPPTKSVRPQTSGVRSDRASAVAASSGWIDSIRFCSPISNMMGCGSRRPMIGTSVSRKMHHSRPDSRTSASAAILLSV